jgi:uroporphyrinogen III methyltransferase/synthase
VALVGAGPGDPGLITVRGARLLALAQVVLYDDLAGVGLLDRVSPEAVRVYVGKRAGRAAKSQVEIQEEILRWARAGRRVVRLKGGDPLVFGRGLEELRMCIAEGIPAELVPGISSVLAVPAYAGFAPTLRGVSSAFTVVTGHEDPSKGASELDWSALARTPGTLIILMGMGRLRQIVAELLLGGRPSDTPAAAIQWGTIGSQREVLAPLSCLPGAVEQAGISSPAVVMVGEVAAAAHRVEWLGQAKPLWGVRVLDTRRGSLSTDFRDLAEAHGAEVVGCPVIATERIHEPGGGPWAEKQLVGSEGGWIVWSSSVGVRLWAEELKVRGWDGRRLSGRKLACVGPSTAQALETVTGLRADLVAFPARQEGLVHGMLDREPNPSEALMMGATNSDSSLEEELLRSGWNVLRTNLYETRSLSEGGARAASLLVSGQVYWVVVTSSSAVESLAHALERIAQSHAGPQQRLASVESVGWISIGPKTSECIRRQGWKVAGEAVEPTASGLYEALVRAVGQKRDGNGFFDDHE